MSCYLAKRSSYSQIDGNTVNSLPAIWSPWKRPRVSGKFAPVDDNSFELYAVCNHHGNMQSGHYTAYCRNPIDGLWYVFDDTKVSPIDESSIVTQDAYILFYHRSSLSPAFSSCASSSTSGYSSSASSYFSEHWAFRMPPFNYWPKPSKSQHNLSTDVHHLTNGKQTNFNELLNIDVAQLGVDSCSVKEETNSENTKQESNGTDNRYASLPSKCRYSKLNTPLSSFFNYWSHKSHKNQNNSLERIHGKG